MNRKQRVIIVVSGGVAETYHATKGVEVCIVDFDNAKDRDEPENADGRYADKAEKWMRLAKRGLPLAECDAKSGYEGWYSV